MFGKLARVLMLATAAACSAGAQAGAEPVDLFSVARPDQLQGAAASAPASKGASRERLVAVNGAAFADRAASLRIKMFADAGATFERVSEEAAYGGGTVWRGEGGDGAATLVVADGAVTGRVVVKGRFYRIEPVGGGLHRVAELDRARLPPAGPETIPAGVEGGGTSSRGDAASAAAAAKTTITVLFAYTTKAKTASNNILSDVNLAVALSNQAYKASGVAIRMKLVGAIEAKGYDEDKRSYREALDDLTDQTGAGAPFKAVGARRDQEGADLVALIREGGDFCGLAWLIEEPRPETAGLGYSETSRDCIAFDTVAHEAGHNMGLRHDRYVEPPAPKSAYNYGYVNVAKRVQDIMSYADKCADKEVSCKQVTMFSTPDEKVSGKPFGVPKGKKGAADAARRLNETRAGVAAYRPDSSGDAAHESADAAAAREAAAD